MAKEFGHIEVGSRVFVCAMGALREYKIDKIFLADDGKGGLKGKVEASFIDRHGICNPHSFSLDGFIEGILAAQDMKISDIDR